MKELKVSADVVQQLIETSLPKMLEEALINKYDSPLKKAVDEAVKEHDGPIKVFVNQVISEALSDPDFKKRVGDAVITKVIASGLSK